MLITPKVILDSSHDISIGYTKVSENPLDVYVKVKENNVTSAYNKSGVLIWTEDITGARTYYDPENPQGTIDVDSLNFDSTYLNDIKEELPNYKLSDVQKIITIYDEGNDTPVEIVTAGQSITYFDQGFATKVVDKNGVTQVVYTYDENKNVIKVEFVDARKKLEENYQKAISEIVTQKEAALTKLAQAEASARADIAAKAIDLQSQIDAEKFRLEAEKAKYDPNVYDLSEFDKVFRELDDYKTQLEQQIQDAYADLDEQVAASRVRIEADASTAMQDLIDDDYNKILADIVQKESSPLIYQYYRKVLGRDPGDDDLLYWTNIAKTELRSITATELTQYIENLPEYTERVTRKQNIISNITSFFTDYFSASEPAKETMLSSLGFTTEEISSIIQSTLTQADVDAIVSWLTSQSLHFGDSAFETIISMLESSGINKSFEDIAKDAIKVDILTGVITKDITGDLLISMYAMRKSAQANGFTLYSSKITYDDLKDMISRGNVTVHIDGKHYVLVTSIDDVKGTITYIDPTVGQNGQEMTLSRSEFMGKWKGYSLAKELPADPAKQLNIMQEKNIRGSGWWEDFWKGIVNFFSKIIAPVATILLMIPPLAPVGAILLGINIIIQTISFVVRTGTLMDVVWSVVNTIGAAIGASILPGIYDAVGKVFSSIGQAIFAPLQGVFSAVMPIFNNLSTAVSNIATGIGQIVSLGTTSAEIAADIGYNIIAKGISLGTDMLFKNLNLDPSLANIGSALLTGAIMGAVSPNGNIETNIIAGALTRGTIAGVEEIGKATDLDPNITYLSAMMAGYLVGGALDIDGRHLTYDELMSSITRKMIDEAGFIGINELGNILGLDPRISYTLGVTLGTSLGTGYIRDPITGDWKFDVDRMWRGAINGLTNPRTLSIAFSVAGDAIGLDPIYNNIIINLAMGAIEGGLENPQDIISGMFKGIFDNFIQTSIRALTLDLYDPLTGGWNKNWQAEYTTIHLINFIEIVQRDGIVPALEHYMSTIFRDDAIRSINEVGGIADFLTGHAEIVYEDGVAKKKINFTDDYKLYLDPNTDEVIGRDYGTTKERGAYGVNPFTNGFGLIDGTLEETTENGSVIYHVRDSVIIDRIDFSGARGHYSILANSLETGFELNENGIPLGGVVMDFEGNRIFQYEWVGDAVRAELNFDNPSNTNIKNVVNVDFSGLTNEQKQEVINYYLIMNGIKNREFYGSPRYMFNFEDRLQTISPGYDDITLVPLYNDKMPKIDANSLEEIVGYQKDLLFDNLKESGYINEDGTLKKTFYDLAGAQDMMLYPEFEEKRQIIYDFLVQLNTTFFNNANDLLRDIADWCLKTDAIANQIYQKLVETYGTNWPSDMTGLGYSGSGDPFLYMLNNNPQIDVNAIVLVGTPIKGDRWVENTNVDTVVTLYGEKDYVFLNSNQFLRQDFYASKGRLFENNPRQINEVVIKLKDIGHTDYFYDPSNPGTNAVLKQKATEFIARVTALAKDSDALSRFLNDTYGIDRDSTGKYVVDLERIIYNG